MTQHVRVMCDALGMSFDDFEPAWLGFADGADALVAGEVDAQFQCPIPNAVMTELSRRADIAVLPLADDQIARLLAAVPYYRRVTMQKGAFRGLEADCDQIGVLNVLVTHARTDYEMVKYVAHSMCEHAHELEIINPLFRGLPSLFEPMRQDGAEAMEHGGVALHDGAVVAYREAGYLD
jgi:TRAP transporter TAXI family solute receptor